MADYGRVSAVIAEAAIEVPSGDAKGRVSAVIAETAITMPASDAKGRVSAVIAEAAVTEAFEEARAGFLFLEVFTNPPVRVTAQVESLGGGIQGRRRLNTLRR